MNILPPMTFHDWLRYAVKNSVHPHIIAFLCMNPNKLAHYSSTSWDILNGNLRKFAGNDKLVREIAVSILGRDVGLEFYDFHKSGTG